MSWAVAKQFADSKDNYYVYQAGDKFPRDGKLVKPERIAELKEKGFVEEVAVERKTEDKPKKAAKSKSKE